MGGRAVLAIVEPGVGSARAVVLDAAGALAEAHIERPGPRPGDLWDARLLRVDNGRGVVALGAQEALLEAGAPGVALGSLLRVEVSRAAIPGPLRAKRARATPTGDAPGSAAGLVRAGPGLAARLRARGLRVEPARAADGLPGWDEALAEARLDAAVPFPGGELACALTEAGLVIDVDGHLPPGPLAMAAVPAVAALLARHGVGGSVLVDFPSLAGKAGRTALDRALRDALAATLAGPWACTAINGFGLVQIVLPRVRPSLIDLAVAAPAELAALELLRAVGRASAAGAYMVLAAPAVIRWLEARPALLAEAARRAGRPLGLQADPALGIWAGHVHACAP